MELKERGAYKTPRMRALTTLLIYVVGGLVSVYIAYRVSDMEHLWRLVAFLGLVAGICLWMAQRPGSMVEAGEFSLSAFCATMALLGLAGVALGASWHWSLQWSIPFVALLIAFTNVQRIWEH